MFKRSVVASATDLTNPTLSSSAAPQAPAPSSTFTRAGRNSIPDPTDLGLSSGVPETPPSIFMGGTVMGLGFRNLALSSTQPTSTWFKRPNFRPFVSVGSSFTDRRKDPDRTPASTLDFLIGLKLAEEEENVVFAFDRMSLAREVSIVSVSFLTFAFETLGRLGVAAGVGAVAEGVASRGCWCAMQATSGNRRNPTL